MADYAHWCRVDHWKPDQIVALTLRRDPRKVNWFGSRTGDPKGVQSLVQISPFAKAYEDRMRIVDSAFYSGALSNSTPWSIANWARTKGFVVAPEWEKELDELGWPITDLRAALKGKEAHIEHLETEIVRLTAVLPTSTGKVHHKTKNSFYAIIYALAAHGTKRPSADDVPALVKKVVEWAALSGFAIDDQTARKHLLDSIAYVAEKQRQAK